MKLASLLAVVLLAGCASPPPPGLTTPAGPSPLPLPDAPADATLVEANTAFALDLMRVLAAGREGGNLVVSPFSLSVALAMAHEGADGSTRASMERTLRLVGVADPAAEFRALLDNVTSGDPNATLDVADALWMDEAFGPDVNASFVDVVARSFLADVFARDFAAATTVDDVNAWASDKTHRKVPKVIESIDAAEVMLLMNAVYFNGTWSSTFSRHCTHSADFARSDGSVVSVDMMCGTSAGAITGRVESGLAAARLPYGSGRFALYVLMPDDLGAFAANATPERLNAALQQARVGDADVSMPKVRLKNDLELAGALTDLGMGVAFSDQADFGRIAPGLMISRVLQSALIDVDENGTVAAAVTTVVFTTTGMVVREPIAFDRPYMLVLRDDATESILFLALVEDPTKE